MRPKIKSYYISYQFRVTNKEFVLEKIFNEKQNEIIEILQWLDTLQIKI